jgi:glycosyltransferase involved in cell wall biosynthesis
VRILGGGTRALHVLGTKPKNWTIHKYGSMDPRTFLSGLDFFVHYPHEDYIEEFGRAVIEAMAVGCPVILPQVFRETFGTAALYSEPADVWSAIKALWSDENAYLVRAQAGQDYVRENCGWEQLRYRLERLTEFRAGESAVLSRIM